MWLDKPLFLLSWSKDSNESIFGSISFYDYFGIEYLVDKDWSRSEYFFEGIECFIAWDIKVTRSIFLC